MIRAAFAALALTLAAPATAQTREADAAGHYYLQGEMETGSELLLKPDGSYQWYISVGALDMASEGRWRRDGARIVLTPTPRGAGPILTLQPLQPWRGDGANAYAEQAFAAAWRRAEDRCYFLARVTGEEPEAIPPDAALPDPAADRARIAALRESAVKMWTDAAATKPGLDHAVAALAKLTPDSPGWEEASRAAYNAYDLYENAYRNAIALYQRAGQPAPTFPAYPVPPVCGAPDKTRFTPDPTPHVAVRLTDAASGGPLGNLLLHARLADGSEPAPVEVKRGWAFLPLKPGTPLQRLWLGADGPPIASPAQLGVDVAIAAPATVPLTADAARLSPPPFETMILTAVSDGWKSDLFRSGRYVRGR